MKRVISISIVLLLVSVSVVAQPERMAVGLAFAEKIWFNGGDTGNPGVNVKTWINLDKRKTMSIAPSLTAYKPHTMGPVSYSITNYFFHGDVDFQYRFFNEGTLTIVGIGGLNFTYIYSAVTLNIASYIDPPQNEKISGFGPNIGAGLEMRMADNWDFNVNAKYAFPGLEVRVPGTVSVFDENKPKLLSSPLTALVIQVQAVYYFKGRRKGYRR